MFKRFTTGMLAMAAMLLPGGADAHRVYPMTYELSPTGAGASTVLRVENTTDQPITLEVSAERRSWDENGKETRTPANDDFVVLPPQMIVQPGKTQAVRVQYVGPPVTTDTAMYVIGINQVPVRDPNAATGVQFVINFGTAAYVVPVGAKTVLSVVSVEKAAEPGMMRVVLENTGARYAPLGNTNFTFTNAAGQRMELNGDPLREALVASVVPSHGRRIYMIRAAQGFDLAGPLKLAIR